MNNDEFKAELSKRMSNGITLFDEPIRNINNMKREIVDDTRDALRKLQRVYGTATSDLIRFSDVVLEDRERTQTLFAINEHGLCRSQIDKEDTSRKYYSRPLDDQELINMISDDEVHNKMVAHLAATKRMKILGVWMGVHACAPELKIINRIYTENNDKSLKIIPTEKLTFHTVDRNDNERITKKELEYLELQDRDSNFHYIFSDAEDGENYYKSSVGHMLMTLQHPIELMKAIEVATENLKADYDLLQMAIKKIDEKLAPYTVVFTLYDSQR